MHQGIAAGGYSPGRLLAGRLKQRDLDPEDAAGCRPREGTNLASQHSDLLAADAQAQASASATARLSHLV